MRIRRWLHSLAGRISGPERSTARSPLNEAAPTADPADISSRRSFLDWLLAAAGSALSAAIVYPLVRFVVPPETAEAAALATAAPVRASELPPNSGRVFRFGDRPAILVRTPNGELRCFDAVCTHLACTVQYRDDLGHIWCACHNGHYDLQGRNIAGPPPRPLPEHIVNVRNDEIIVSKSS